MPSLSDSWSLADVALALLGLLLGVGLGAALAEALEPALDLCHVGEGELEVDDGDVGEGVHLAVDMNDVVVVEASDDVDDGIALADVGEELVAEAGAVCGALDQARDVDKLHRRGDDVRGAADGGEGLEAVVGDGDDPGVRLDGAEGVVGRLREKRAEEERGRESGEVHRERRRIGRQPEHRDARDVAGRGSASRRTRGRLGGAVLDERVAAKPQEEERRREELERHGRHARESLRAWSGGGGPRGAGERPRAEVRARSARTKGARAQLAGVQRHDGHGGRFARAKSPAAASVQRRSHVVRISPDG